MHPEPIMRAKPCPEEMQPEAAKRFANQARDAGWDVRVGIAIGYRRVGRHDSEVFRPVRSVMVEARRAGSRITALWVGQVDGSEMKFDNAWRGWKKLGARDLKTEVDAL